MAVILIAAVVGLVLGFVLGLALCWADGRRLRRRLRELRSGTAKASALRSVTRFLFVTTQIFAIVWVSWSYGIATYSTIALQEPFPVEELSSQAINTILGMGVIKVVGNIFEHNEGKLFGKSVTDDTAEDQEPPGVG